MISVVRSSNSGLSEGKDDAVGVESQVGLNGGGASVDEGLNSAVPSEEEEARVSNQNAVKSEEAMVSKASVGATNESGVFEFENVENRSGDAYGGALENQVSSSTPRLHGAKVGDKTDSQEGKVGETRPSGISADYDSMLSGFDEFVAKGKGEGVDYGYQVGDMVWGKVKSHPWWPGLIYNEAFASPSVQRSKREGHALVAFFGDGSYGWFDTAELIPFEKNFAEKSRQTLSRTFLKAVEEAADEVSRRRGLGLSCCCRNKYNFWPTSAEGFVIVNVAGYEPGGVYSTSQIEKARHSFQPREMRSFLEQAALTPWTDAMLDLVKNKATVLAYRKATFEEYDETYAQAFGSVFVRPARPTGPPIINSSKDPLSGRLVIAEALGKEKSSAKSFKTKDQNEKEKYLFKRRDKPKELKTNKAILGQASSTVPFTLDHVHQIPDTTVSEHHGLTTSHQASAELQKEKLQADLGGSKKLLDNGVKKSKVHKRSAGEISTDNQVEAEKKKKKRRKKETGIRPSTGHAQIPAAVSNIGAAVERVSETSTEVSPSEKYKLSSVETSQPVGIVNADFELAVLHRDLQTLALDPFHGTARRSPTITKQVFLKFRSLVYQKSLALSAPADSESNETCASKLPAARGPSSADENIKETATMKPVKPPPVRQEDPGKGGKRGPSDRLEEIAAKKKKKLDNLKSLAAEKKVAAQKAINIPRGEVNETGARSVPPTSTKALKLESSKRTEQPTRAAERTMLVMKFPPGGALPSIAELKAKFARFGPLDHSGTRVFWKSYTCRLVYQHKEHAQAALKFAMGSGNLFGNTNVRCYLREMETEAQESEPTKVQKDDLSVGFSQEPRPAAKLSVQPVQHGVQLKSCLKRPFGDDGGGNGGGRSTRVKFTLSGDESGRGSEQLLGGNESTKNIGTTTFHEGASSSTHSLDVSSKNLPKVIPHSSNPPISSSNQFQNLRFSEQVSASFNTPSGPPHLSVPTTNNDIAQQMLNLLMKCNDVVNNLRGNLGYVPYRPL